MSIFDLIFLFQFKGRLGTDLVPYKYAASLHDIHESIDTWWRNHQIEIFHITISTSDTEWELLNPLRQFVWIGHLFLVIMKDVTILDNPKNARENSIILILYMKKYFLLHFCCTDFLTYQSRSLNDLKSYSYLAC